MPFVSFKFTADMCFYINFSGTMINVGVNYTMYNNFSFRRCNERERERILKILYFFFQGKNITREVFEMLWIEYFVSNERAARGNYLFGIPDFIWKLFNLDQEFLPFGYRERSDKVSPRVIVLYKAKAASLCINFKLIDISSLVLIILNWLWT